MKKYFDFLPQSKHTNYNYVFFLFIFVDDDNETIVSVMLDEEESMLYFVDVDPSQVNSLQYKFIKTRNYPNVGTMKSHTVLPDCHTV